MKYASIIRPRGFLLLEMVLAISVFALAATGFVVALQGMSKTAAHAQTELRATRILESALNEAISQPALKEGEESYVTPDGEIDILEQVEPVEGLENEEGLELNDIFRIRITARWYENGEWQERDVETWRYARLYQP